MWDKDEDVIMGLVGGCQKKERGRRQKTWCLVGNGMFMISRTFARGRYSHIVSDWLRRP